jgi:hypothetical protein
MRDWLLQRCPQLLPTLLEIVHLEALKCITCCTTDRSHCPVCCRLCFPEGQEHLAALSKAKLVIISQEMLLQVITRLQTKANILLRDNAAGVPGQGERHMCRGVLWEAICHLRFLGEQKHLVSPQVKKFRDHESDPISNTEMEAFCYPQKLQMENVAEMPAFVVEVYHQLVKQSGLEFAPPQSRGVLEGQLRAVKAKQPLRRLAKPLQEAHGLSFIDLYWASIMMLVCSGHLSGNLFPLIVCMCAHVTCDAQGSATNQRRFLGHNSLRIVAGALIATSHHLIRSQLRCQCRWLQSLEHAARLGWRTPSNARATGCCSPLQDRAVGATQCVP